MGACGTRSPACAWGAGHLRLAWLSPGSFKALRTGRRAVMPLLLAHGGCLRDALWHCLSWHRSRLWCLGRAADTGLGLAGSTVCSVGEP